MESTKIWALLEILGKITEENRNITFPVPGDGLAETIKGFMTPDLDSEMDAAISEHIRQHRLQDIPSPTELTHKSIVCEINFLFDLLRYGYGAYQYFGGDDIFKPLKGAMLEQLTQMTDPLSTDSYLNNLLLPSLRSVIVDNHFWLGDSQIGVSSQLFMNDELVIRRIESDLIVEIDGVAYRVLTDGILPTLTREGELAWAFGHVAYGLQRDTPREVLEVSVRLEDIKTNEGHARMVSLYPVPDTNISSKSVFTISESEKDKITILENRMLWQEDDDPTLRFRLVKELEDFAQTGATLRSKPILILDLRDHNGGNGDIAREWIQRYTGHNPSYSMMFRHITLNSLTTSELNAWTKAASPPCWNMDTDDEHRFIPNENLVIVLIDNRVASSGECFVGYLRQLENVLFVGANTRGVLVTGNVGIAVLPYSRLGMRFGVALNARADLSQFEGVGFSPDLWVPPNESLERILRFIGLTKEMP